MMFKELKEVWKFKEICGNRLDFVRLVDLCCVILIYDVYDFF